MDKKVNSEGSRKETPKERTVRLLAEAREQFKRHEHNSRASGGRNQFSLSHKLRVTLPFIAIVFGLYGWSLLQTQRKYEDIKKRKQIAAADPTDNENEPIDQPRNEEILTDGLKW